MDNIVIRAEKLSKLYRIGLSKRRHDTLRDAISDGFRSLFKKKRESPDSDRTLWALKDISFEIEQGEILGIIGRNGAGKSTLLKILSRITSPTEGRAEIYGRVRSLLEVGTGFHAELTGRENVFLNGAILGMTKAEIVRKFDEIVAFAEVERFIDTPVKRYSNGMYVRLAFSVAAHLEPEILIIDEVLAVGDAGFQAKCIGKMGAVAREGRTVLFVSHNLGAVSNLCTKALWIDKGRLALQGNVKDTISSYLKSTKTMNQADTRNWQRRKGSGDGRFTAVRLLDGSGNDCTTFAMGDTVVIEFDIEFVKNLPEVGFTLEISRTEMGMRVLQIQNDDSGFEVRRVAPGTRRFRIQMANCLLYPAAYDIMLAAWAPGNLLDYIESPLTFSMVQSDVTKRTSSLRVHKEAIFYAPATWSEHPPVSMQPLRRHSSSYGISG
jgi:lipopolysaccharide transport system ATP-binding protein